jgi:hypothetical protein
MDEEQPHLSVNYNEYLEFQDWKKKNAIERQERKTDYIDTINWAKIALRYNHALTSGARKAGDIRVYFKVYKGKTQLQIWHRGGVHYIFDVVDATDRELEYNLIHNIQEE